MRVKKINLKGYKRFHDLTIDLGNEPKRIVALVGPNGCGKSSVFDAMLFLNNHYYQIGETPGKDNIYHSLDMKTIVNYDNIKIEFDKGEGLFNIIDKRRKEGIGNTIFSFRSPYRHNANVLVKENLAIPELKLNRFGASTTSDIDEKMEQNYRRLQIKYNNYLNAQDCKPSEAKKYIIGELNESIENCIDLKIDNLGNIEEGKGTLFFSKDDYDSSFSFNVLSAGEKEVVDLLLDLYLRKDYYTDSIFIIDEPELHINTSIQRKLLLEINKLIGKNCQLWIATHSIGFLRALQEDLKDDCQIIEFKSGNNWANEEYTLEPIKSNHETWKSLFSTALDDLAYLVSPKRIVYCEGTDKPGRDNSERGLDAIVYNNIFNKNYPDTLFVSSGGNTELDKNSQIAISIMSKVFPEIEILVLKDRDMASGKITNENDRREYLNNNPDNHRVLKRWEIENYIFDKEVIEAYCKEKDEHFSNEEYDKIVNNVINDELKEKINHFRNLCGITGSIGKEQFKINLSTFITEDMEIYKELEKIIFNRL